VNQEAKNEDLMDWYEAVRIGLGGVPKRLTEPAFYSFVKLGTGRVLIEGDDMVLLEQIREAEK
jgi:hypothetical protein